MKRILIKILINILLLLVSPALGAYSCYLFLTILFSTGNSFISTKDTPLLLRSLYILLVIIGGYGSLLVWLRKFRSELFIMVNVVLYLIFLVLSPFFASVISDIKTNRAIPSQESRQELYKEINDQIANLDLSYYIDIDESEKETKIGKKIPSIILVKTTNEEIGIKDVRTIISIFPEKEIHTTIYSKSKGGYIGLRLNSTKEIISCVPFELCQKLDIVEKQ